MSDPPLAFELEWLANRAPQTPEVDVCELGHLRSRKRTCWKPTAFTTGLTSVWCEPVDHEPADG